MSEDIAEQFFQDVMELEESLSAGSAAFATGSPDEETVNAAFRAVHSLKGTAGFLASDDGRFGTLNKYCHLFENFLDSLRRRARPLDAEACKIAVTSIDALLADLDKMRDGGTPGLHEEMAADFLEKPKGSASTGENVPDCVEFELRDGVSYIRLRRDCDRLNDFRALRDFVEQRFFTAERGTRLVLDLRGIYRISSMLVGTIGYLAGRGLVIYILRPTPYARQFVFPRMQLDPEQVRLIEMEKDVG
ncbi:MAG: Hpt domain-containing protein [Nitrospinae bacterium]|nr:Hpt domain-containing protein [Nitrospinota bacterium]